MPMIDTVLDPRFSAPGALPTSWERTRRILEDAEVSWISTVRQDLRPHVSHVFQVVPTKVLAFAKAPFGQTRHRFVADDRSAPS